MNNVTSIIENYITLFPDHSKDVDELLDLSKTNLDLFNRKSTPGHIPSNAFVINDNNEVLLVFHSVLKQFFQPGGHIEPEDNGSPVQAAIRELREETGITDATLLPWHIENNETPITILNSFIPENPNKNEPDHLHYEFMYVFRTSSTEVILDDDGVSDYKWLPIAKIPEENNILLSTTLDHLRLQGLL